MAETKRTVEFLPLVEEPGPLEDDDMFTVDCPAHRSKVLLSETRLRALKPVATGLQMEWECWCGHRGASLTGRPPMVGRHRPAV